MKKLITVLATLLIIGSSLALAQSGNNADCKDPSSSLLWKVAGDNSEVYLFGSLHLGLPEFYPLAEEIEAQLSNADYLVFEVDPGTMNTPAAQQSLLQKAQLPSGQTLTDVLPPALLDDLKSQLTSMGLPAQQFLQFRPWFLTITLPAVQMMQLGYQPNYGVEMYVYGNKPPSTKVMELESMEEQLEFLSTLNSQAYLQYTLDTMEEGKDIMHATAEAWACADKADLTELMVESFDMPGIDAAEIEAVKAKILYDRNERMADKIEEYIQSGDGNYFVTVGAAHYLGDKSIVDVLRKKGYDVEAVELQ